MLRVHLREVVHGVLQRVAKGHVDLLLALHGALHHRVVRLERVGVVGGAGEDLGLDTLAQAVLAHRADDLALNSRPRS